MKTIKGAFHIHSNFSYDGRVSIKKIKEIYKKAGYSFVIMTEHGESFNNKRWLNYSNFLRRISTPNFIFIPGIELNFGKGMHIILLGNLTDIELTDIDQVRMSATSNGVVAIGAHIYTMNFDSELAWLDGAEIFNSRYNKNGVPPAKSIKLFKKWKKKNNDLWTIFGTDYHKESDFRQQSIEMNISQISEDIILDRIAKGVFNNSSTFSIGNKTKIQFRQSAQLPISFELFYLITRLYCKFKSIIISKLTAN